MKKNVIKFLSWRGSKNLPLTVFLAEKMEKTEPNYDIGYNLLCIVKFVVLKLLYN